MPTTACFGDCAVLVDARLVDARSGDARSGDTQTGDDRSGDTRQLLADLGHLEHVEEVLPGAVICVRVTPGRAREVAEAVDALVAGAAAPGDRTALPAPRRVELSICFDGPDLEEVASRAGMSAAQVADAIAGATLRVAYLGFSPGFAYVTGLPGRLSEIGRRRTPRTSVPAGSVGIAGGYLGIYPQASPGGWNLVGRTDAVLFDPDTPPYSTLRPGDVLKLSPATGIGPAPAAAYPSARPRCDPPRRIVVEDPGILTMLQDRGRIGVAHLGVPRAGPADPDSMRLANLMVGNPGHYGVLETTVRGPALRFCERAYAAVVGAGVDLDGRDVEPGAVIEVPAGGRVRIGESRELRAYVAVSGGIRGPEHFASCSSDLLSGLGPGRLSEGDELGFGETGRPRGYCAPLSRGPQVRVLAGPERVDPDRLAEWLSRPFEVGTDSNRIGVRLAGSRPLPLVGPPIGSYGMVPGAVQLPPSAEPIVLLCDHATMGGYPVVATVISADIGIVAQRRPGDSIQFELVDLETAAEARSSLDRRIAHAPTGIYPSGPVA
ncbi:MAG TPA: carboxyltransferase domain-containing protein [Acidimicrobiales bacterium]|nr:carboxyltransferase domain-containing protein [Acidimicrobiales bacterium]